MHGEAYADGAKAQRVLQTTAELFVRDRVETAINSAVTMHLGRPHDLSEP